MAQWGYKKGEGRFYERESGSLRFPDSGDIRNTKSGRVIGSEPVGNNLYGADKVKKKKLLSKPYRVHKLKIKGKTVKRGGYRRKLR
ncbi:MAG: hypothetical protein U9O94_08500 [Nanoarchaeota archaeon]|nr:hypothetical protein [Nanoarchaeota archaeon]